MKISDVISRIGRYRTRAKQLEVFRREFEAFGSQLQRSPRGFRLAWEDRFPILDERTATTEFDRHYVYHTSWAARILAKRRPKFHVDIASSLYFAGIASAFVPVRFYDYRPADLRLNNLTSGSIDLTRLAFEDKSISSLSCMHVVEHIGLGRYGDPLDADGDLKAMNELQRVVAKRGSLLFVVPVGAARIQFNAHRIYSYEQVRESFSRLTLKEFSLVPDNAADGGLIVNAPPQMVKKQRYGCGCFLFTRT